MTPDVVTKLTPDESAKLAEIEGKKTAEWKCGAGQGWFSALIIKIFKSDDSIAATLYDKLFNHENPEINAQTLRWFTHGQLDKLKEKIQNKNPKITPQVQGVFEQAIYFAKEKKHSADKQHMLIQTYQSGIDKTAAIAPSTFSTSSPQKAPEASPVSTATAPAKELPARPTTAPPANAQEIAQAAVAALPKAPSPEAPSPAPEPVVDRKDSPATPLVPPATAHEAEAAQAAPAVLPTATLQPLGKEESQAKAPVAKAPDKSQSLIEPKEQHLLDPAHFEKKVMTAKNAEEHLKGMREVSSTNEGYYIIWPDSPDSKGIYHFSGIPKAGPPVQHFDIDLNVNAGKLTFNDEKKTVVDTVKNFATQAGFQTSRGEFNRRQFLKEADNFHDNRGRGQGIKARADAMLPQMDSNKTYGLLSISSTAETVTLTTMKKVKTGFYGLRTDATELKTTTFSLTAAGKVTDEDGDELSFKEFKDKHLKDVTPFDIEEAFWQFREQGQKLGFTGQDDRVMTEEEATEFLKDVENVLGSDRCKTLGTAAALYEKDGRFYLKYIDARGVRQADKEVTFDEKVFQLRDTGWRSVKDYIWTAPQASSFKELMVTLQVKDVKQFQKEIEARKEFLVKILSLSCFDKNAKEHLQAYKNTLGQEAVKGTFAIYTAQRERSSLQDVRVCHMQDGKMVDHSIDTTSDEVLKKILELKDKSDEATLLSPLGVGNLTNNFSQVRKDYDKVAVALSHVEIAATKIHQANEKEAAIKRLKEIRDYLPEKAVGSYVLVKNDPDNGEITAYYLKEGTKEPQTVTLNLRKNPGKIVLPSGKDIKNVKEGLKTEGLQEPAIGSTLQTLLAKRKQEYDELLTAFKIDANNEQLARYAAFCGETSVWYVSRKPAEEGFGFYFAEIKKDPTSNSFTLETKELVLQENKQILIGDKTFTKETIQSAANAQAKKAKDLEASYRSGAAREALVENQRATLPHIPPGKIPDEIQFLFEARKKDKMATEAHYAFYIEPKEGESEKIALTVANKTQSLLIEKKTIVLAWIAKDGTQQKQTIDMYKETANSLEEIAKKYCGENASSLQNNLAYIQAKQQEKEKAPAQPAKAAEPATVPSNAASTPTGKRKFVPASAPEPLKATPLITLLNATGDSKAGTPLSTRLTAFTLKGATEKERFHNIPKDVIDSLETLGAQRLLARVLRKPDDTGTIAPFVKKSKYGSQDQKLLLENANKNIGENDQWKKLKVQAGWLKE